MFRKLLDIYPSYMLLRLYVNGDNDLKIKYMDAVQKHNNKIFANPLNIDAGFDLYMPKQTECVSLAKLDHQIACSAKIITSLGSYNTGYTMHPRSSVSKTPLRLANSTGIIDSGYRGNLIGVFDCHVQGHVIEKHDRLLQICAPSLMPIVVELVESAEDLGDGGERGTGGFGSTGK